MHSQCMRGTDSLLVLLCLQRAGDLKTQTGSEITAARDQALKTKYRATKILQTETENKCKPCKQFDERIGHIISPCPMLTKGQYRHVSVLSCTLTYAWKLEVKLGNERWYVHAKNQWKPVMNVR